MRGKQVGADGRTYDGEWHRGDREGVGKEELTSGETYEGEWLADRRHGDGAESSNHSRVHQVQDVLRNHPTHDR